MKIIRKAIYPSPCSLLFLPFLLSLPLPPPAPAPLSYRCLRPSLSLSLSLSLSPLLSVVLPYYFIHTLNGNRVPVLDERLVPSLMEISERSLDAEIVRIVITYCTALIILITFVFSNVTCRSVIPGYRAEL